MLSPLLDALATVGELADKTTGGRAVRGLLAGHPGEIFSPLPFSDTLGLTDPAQATSGKQLLRQYGLTDEDDPIGGLKGFAAEMLLDPGNLLGGAGMLRGLRGAGALDDAGDAASALGRAVGRFAADETGAMKWLDLGSGLAVPQGARFQAARRQPGVRNLILPRKPSPELLGMTSSFPGGPIEAQAARRLFPDAIADDDELFRRIAGIELDPDLQGHGVGQAMYLDMLGQQPGAWHYNSQAEEPAVRALDALGRKGLAEVHWRRPGGPHVARPTEEGYDLLSRIHRAMRRFAADESGALVLPGSAPGVYVPKNTIPNYSDFITMSPGMGVDYGAWFRALPPEVGGSEILPLKLFADQYAHPYDIIGSLRHRRYPDYSLFDALDRGDFSGPAKTSIQDFIESLYSEGESAVASGGRRLLANRPDVDSPSEIARMYAQSLDDVVGPPTRRPSAIITPTVDEPVAAALQKSLDEIGESDLGSLREHLLDRFADDRLHRTRGNMVTSFAGGLWNNQPDETTALIRKFLRVPERPDDLTMDWIRRANQDMIDSAEAAGTYFGPSYYHLNQMFRDPAAFAASPPIDPRGIEKLGVDLDKLFRFGRLPDYDEFPSNFRSLVRGVDAEGVPKIAEQLGAPLNSPEAVGRSFVDPAFLSTTYHRPTAEQFAALRSGYNRDPGVVFDFGQSYPVGSPAAYMNAAEHEILLPRGRTITVRDNSRYPYIDATLKSALLALLGGGAYGAGGDVA